MVTSYGICLSVKEGRASVSYSNKIKSDYGETNRIEGGGWWRKGEPINTLTVNS